MLSEREARRIGVNRCVDLIGRDFCMQNRNRSVSSFGKNGKIVDVFVGVSDEDDKKEKLTLSEKPFKFRAIVYVDMTNGNISDGEYVSAK